MARDPAGELQKAAAAAAARDPELIALREELAALKRDEAADALAASTGTASPGAGQSRGEDKYTWAPGRVALSQHAELTSSFAPSPNFYAPLRGSQPDMPASVPPSKPALHLYSPQDEAATVLKGDSRNSHPGGKCCQNFSGPPESIN